MTRIWVDADACPVVMRDILFRAANRTRTRLTLVANRPLRPPPSPWIDALQVASGFDVADDEILERVSAGDLVITSDIPLAAEVIDKGAHVLTPRGDFPDRGSIRARLNMRDFMETLRASGVQTGGPPSLGVAEKQAFANALDRFLARHRSGDGQ